MDHTRLDGRSYTTTPSRAMLAANSGLDVRLGSTTSIRYVIDKSSNGDVSHVSQLCTFPQATRFPLPKLVQPRYATNQLEPCGVASSTRGCSPGRVLMYIGMHIRIKAGVRMIQWLRL